MVHDPNGSLTAIESPTVLKPPLLLGAWALAAIPIVALLLLAGRALQARLGPVGPIGSAAQDWDPDDPDLDSVGEGSGERRRGGRRVTSGKKKKRRPAGSYRAPAAAPPPKRGLLDSLFSRPTGVSPMPKIRTTFARGLTTVLGAPVLVIAVPVVLLAEWAILLAFGFQGPFSLLSAVFGVPPVSTYADVILSSSAFAPASGGGVGSSIGPLIGIVLFLTVNAAIHAWVTTASVESLRTGGISSWAVRRAIHVLPVTVAVGVVNLGILILANITQVLGRRHRVPRVHRAAHGRRLPVRVRPGDRRRRGPPDHGDAVAVGPGRPDARVEQPRPSRRSTRSRRSRSCSPRCRAA